MAPTHDPAGDMNWALFGTAVSMLGAFLLALLSVINHDLLMWVGLALAFGGSVLTFVLLMTGGRGRRPARRFLSITAGLMAAAVMATILVGTKIGAQQMITELDIDLGGELARAIPFGIPGNPFVAEASQPRIEPRTQPGSQPRTDAIGLLAQADPAPAEPQGQPAPGVEAMQAPAVAIPEPAAVVAVAERWASPATKPTRSPAPAVRERVEESRAPIAAPAVLSMEGTGQADDVAEGPVASAVPIEAVQELLKNNLGVKQCFVPLFRAKALPPRVEVKFNILPEGSATGLQVESPAEHANGSPLETCLSSAVAAVRFPETSGKGTSIKYPFILQR